MNQARLTTGGWPVSAVDGKAAKNNAAPATSSIVADGLSSKRMARRLQR